ncbi:MAG: DMT family transporter [Pseudomarimonas sp.]
MPFRHLLLVLLICLAWAGNFLTSAAALQHLPPFLFTALRLGLVALLLWPWLRLPATGQWPRLIAISLCSGALHFGFSFWAIQLAGNLASPAIVTQSYVPMTALLAVIFLGERFGWRTSLGIAVSFAGILVLGFDPVVLAAPKSLLLMLLASLLLAVGTVMLRGLTGMHPFNQQAWSAVIGIVPLLAISHVFEHDQMGTLRSAPWVAWFGVAYAAIFASALGHGLFFWLVKRYPVSQVTPYLLITPVFAVALGIAFWGDRPGPRLLIGGAMVLGGVLAIALRARTKNRVLPVA